jgi:hypothetical protein
VLTTLMRDASGANRSSAASSTSTPAPPESAEKPRPEHDPIFERDRCVTSPGLINMVSVVLGACSYAPSRAVRARRCLTLKPRPSWHEPSSNGMARHLKILLLIRLLQVRILQVRCDHGSDLRVRGIGCVLEISPGGCVLRVCSDAPTLHKP